MIISRLSIATPLILLCLSRQNSHNKVSISLACIVLLIRMKNIKNVKLPPLPKEDSFGFLKQGTDKQFESALASIGSTYDDIFKSDTNFNAIFENLKVDNNPILDPIDQMMKQIFDPNDVKDNREYEKISAAQAQRYKEKQYDLALQQREEESESQLLMGEPVYLHPEDEWNYKL